MDAATVTRRAGRAAILSLAAYGAARAYGDWRRRRAAPTRLRAPARALVDEVTAVVVTEGASDAEHAYYEWRAELLAHADEVQPPVDE